MLEDRGVEKMEKKVYKPSLKFKPSKFISRGQKGVLLDCVDRCRDQFCVTGEG